MRLDCLLFKNCKEHGMGLNSIYNTNSLQSGYVVFPELGLYCKPIRVLEGSLNFVKKCYDNVDIFWEGHNILRNLQLTSDYIGQK